MTQALDKARADYVPKANYVSQEFAKLEKERLWTRVWQVACREQELPKIGSYVTYDIGDNSFIVTRTAEDRIKAYHNVCLHRGRRLTSGCGFAARFHCNYHGWRWNLDGSINRVLDRDDWAGCADFDEEALRLREVPVGIWGGFVYLNPDPDAEPLADYLAPVPHFIDPFELDRMRYRWAVSVRLPCNWKVALEAFNEGYHVAATHPQLLDVIGNDLTRSAVFGRHGMFTYPDASRPWGAPSPRTGKPMPDDLRPGLIAFFDEFNQTLKAIYSERDVEAARRLMERVEPTQDIARLAPAIFDLQREAAEAAGAGWPAITLEQMAKAGADWHVFPNQIFLMYPDGALVYRARPDGDNPDSCIFDISAIQRYAPGAEPKVERQNFHGADDWRNFATISIILQQDFDNMEQVQKGMKSDAFIAARPSPRQETSVSNLHRHIADYLARPR